MSRFLAVLCCVGCAASRAVSGAGVEAQLSELASDAGSFGDLVYIGDVAPLEQPTAFVFQYERRVQPTASTSFTREGSTPVVVETASHDADYVLTESTQWQLQTREIGRVRVRDGVVELSQAAGSTERYASEPLREPVVVGPTLFGFIARHRAAIDRGETLVIRFAVPSRLETIPFTLSRVDAPVGQVRVQMIAQSALVRLVVAPLTVTYDANGALMSLDGRVPPKRRSGSSWADFDAHVVYRNVGAFR